ncbi:MAG: hypothetical protein KF870_01530 [Leadbetterella sp.]|nr:hypothetical protein [Leadbetterella sp.]
MPDTRRLLSHWMMERQLAVAESVTARYILQRSCIPGHPPFLKFHCRRWKSCVLLYPDNLPDHYALRKGK